MAAVGTVRLRFEAGEGGRAAAGEGNRAGYGGGIVGWTLRGAATADLDGLPTEVGRHRWSGAFVPHSDTNAPHQLRRHPNGVTKVDHLVVTTPELRRTVSAFEAAGIDLRRVREPHEPGPPVRQAFFRLGEVILEVAENPEAGPGPARFWGITFRVDDIDACARMLGERLGEVRDAVQPGRRIATVRRRAGLGLPVALITASPAPSLRRP